MILKDSQIVQLDVIRSAALDMAESKAGTGCGKGT